MGRPIAVAMSVAVPETARDSPMTGQTSPDPEKISANASAMACV